VRNVDNHRDPLLERLLPGTLHARAADAPSDACLDAEAAAAWADETLAPHERSTAEAHAAGCARCQALLAALVRTSPPTAVHSWFRLPTLAWLAPVTAVAAGLIVWMILPPRATLAPSDRVLSRSEVVATAPAAQPRASAPQASSNQAATAPAERMRQAPAASPNRESRDALEKAAPASAPATAFADASAAATPPPPAPAAPEPPAASAAAPAASTGAPARSAAQTPAPPATVAETAALRAEFTTESVMARRVDAARQPAVIISTNRSYRWRIAADGDVLRSIDGESPSPFVCWLVGPGGTVLLSTDGRSWRALPFQEKVDLVSVRATDDKTATVTAADRRAFSTTDRGVTWTPVPNR
jgi:hypothetical protein